REKPDELNDPKQRLINLARGSRLHTIRSDLAPREGSGRSVGPLYTARMIQFVNDETGGWRPAHALHVSQSLARCINRLKERAWELRVKLLVPHTPHATAGRMKSLDAASAHLRTSTEILPTTYETDREIMARRARPPRVEFTSQGGGAGPWPIRIQSGKTCTRRSRS